MSLCRGTRRRRSGSQRTTRRAITESGRGLAQADHVSGIVDDGSTVSVQVGSGRYRFVVDPARSALGVALAGAEHLSASAAELAADGRISSSERREIQESSRDVSADVRRALGQRESSPSMAGPIADALDTALDLTRWIDGRHLQPEVEKVLADSNQGVVTALSEALRRHVGISAAVTVAPGEHLPGDVVPVSVQVTNSGFQARPGTTAELTAPSGWTVQAHDQAGTVLPGKSRSFRFSVTIPDQAAIAPGALSAEVGFAVSDTPVRVPTAGVVPVASPISIHSLSVEPGSGEPGSRATVRAVLRNRSARAVTGSLSLAVPSGWTAPTPSATTLPAGMDISVELPVDVPLAGNAAPVTLTARFADGRGELVSAPLEFKVTQSLTPADAIDYADLGNAASEAAHKVTAAPSSGTSVEAGRSRRYSGMFVPGSWFEFDLGITAGKPFLMRLVETYDSAQVKNYEVQVNGTVVHRRLNDHKAGAGLETYQFLVDDAALLTGPTVRVRVQFNDQAAGYDPSLADVWSLPLP